MCKTVAYQIERLCLDFDVGSFRKNVYESGCGDKQMPWPANRCAPVVTIQELLPFFNDPSG